MKSSFFILKTFSEAHHRIYGIAVSDFQHDWKNQKYPEEKGPGLRLPLKKGEIVWVRYFSLNFLQLTKNFKILQLTFFA